MCLCVCVCSAAGARLEKVSSAQKARKGVFHEMKRKMGGKKRQQQLFNCRSLPGIVKNTTRLHRHRSGCGWAAPSPALPALLTYRLLVSCVRCRLTDVAHPVKRGVREWLHGLFRLFFYPASGSRYRGGGPGRAELVGSSVSIAVGPAPMKPQIDGVISLVAVATSNQ